MIMSVVSALSVDTTIQILTPTQNIRGLRLRESISAKNLSSLMIPTMGDFPTETRMSREIHTYAPHPEANHTILHVLDDIPLREMKSIAMYVGDRMITIGPKLSREFKKIARLREMVGIWSYVG